MRFKKAIAVFSAAVVLGTMGGGCTTNKSDLLKDVYADYFPIGAAVAQYSIDNFGNDLMKHFNSISAENDMKWATIHPAEDRYNFTMADQLIEYAKENDMVVRGHTLVWNASLPSWVMEDNPSKETLLDRMREHIDTVVKHFGSDVYCWDVVNEVLHATVTEQQLETGDIYRTGSDALYGGSNSGDWYAYCGRDFIAEAFKQARKSLDECGATEVKLFYNDVGLINPYKRQAAVSMIEWLRSEGVPIDGVGLQAHYDVVSFDVDQFEDTVRTFTDMGLDVQVTEADVSIYPWTYNGEVYETLPDDIAKVQAEVFGAIFEVCRRYATPSAEGKGRVTGVTFWTIADDITWLDNDPVPGRKNFPSLFDTEHNPKPAFYKVIDF